MSKKFASLLMGVVATLSLSGSFLLSNYNVAADTKAEVKVNKVGIPTSHKITPASKTIITGKQPAAVKPQSQSTKETTNANGDNPKTTSTYMLKKSPKKKTSIQITKKNKAKVKIISQKQLKKLIKKQKFPSTKKLKADVQKKYGIKKGSKMQDVYVVVVKKKTPNSKKASKQIKNNRSVKNGRTTQVVNNNNGVGKKS